MPADEQYRRQVAMLVLTRTTCIIIDGCRKVNYGEVEAR